MRKDDFPTFCQMLDDCYSLLTKGQNAPSSSAKAMFFRSLADYPIEAVRAGFDAHVKDPQRGRFAPMPADIIAQIDGLVADDGRPGAEEAWAMASRAHDESETVVWTDEMAEAWQVSSSVMAMGDEIGARMAFKESYGRLVESARAQRRPVKWSASLGHDSSKRHDALKVAESRGLIGHDEVLRLAPPSSSGDTAALLLESAQKGDDPELIKTRVAALKKLLERKEPDGSQVELENQQMAAKKADIAARVAAYQEQPQ